jgi:hypothetical protein
MKQLALRRLLRVLSKDRAWLAIQQKQQQPTFWEISATKIEEREDLPANAWPVFSLSVQDLRVMTDKRVGSHRAKSLIRQQCGQAARSINHSTHGAVYGRTLANLPAGYALTPATILVDAMLRERGWPKQPFVVGWLLSAEGSENQILALWSGTARGDLTDVQATENAHDAEPIVESYCSGHGIQPSVDTLILFSLEQVFAAIARHAGRLYAYPDFDDWRGLPIDTLWRASAAASALFALLCLGNVAWHTLRGQWLARTQASALVQEAQARQHVINLFLTNLPAVAQRASVDHRALVSRSRELYVEGGGLVSLKASGVTHLLRVAVPIEPTQATSLDNVVTLTTPVAVLDQAYVGAARARPPVPVAVAGGGNEVVFDHPVPAANARLLSYIDR